MEVEREQSWRVRVTAKAKHFNFRFRFAAATYASTRTLSFFRFSILLNLPKFVFQISSQPKKQERARFKFITTKVMKIFHKFRPRFPKNRPNVAAKTKTASNLSYPKDPIRIGFCLMGFLACLVQSIISKKDHVRIVMMMLASVGFLVASLLLKNFKTVKLMNLTAFLLVGAVTMVCYLFFNFDYYSYWEYMGRSAWNKIVKLGNL